MSRNFRNFLRRFGQTMSLDQIARFPSKLPDDISKEELKAQTKEVVNQAKVKVNEKLPTAMQAFTATVTKAVGSNNLTKKQTENHTIGPFNGMHYKILRGTLSSFMALHTREKMTKEGYSKEQINWAVTIVDQIISFAIEPLNQRDSIEKDAKANPEKKLKIPTMAKTYQANLAAFPIFTLRLFLLWQATNEENTTMLEKASKAAGYSFLAAPFHALGIQVGREFNQGANEKTWEAYKLAAGKLGWTGVLDSIKNQSFAEFKSALAKAIRETYKGSIPASIAVGISAILLSKECGEAFKEAFATVKKSLIDDTASKKVTLPSTSVKPTDSEPSKDSKSQEPEI